MVDGLGQGEVRGDEEVLALVEGGLFLGLDGFAELGGGGGVAVAEEV